MTVSGSARTVPMSHRDRPIGPIALDRILQKHVNVRPSVRPASADKIVTLFVDPSSPNLEHIASPYHTEETILLSSSIRISIRACATVQLSSVG